MGQPGDRISNIRNIKANQYDLCSCDACYHCLANSGTMISAHSNHAIFLDYIDRAKLVDSQTVFVFSVGGLDTSQYLLIEIGRICPKLEQVVSNYSLLNYKIYPSAFPSCPIFTIFFLQELVTSRLQ